MKTSAQRTAVAGTARKGGAGHGRSGSLRRDGFWPWLFVGPELVGVTVFFLWPIAQTAYFSLTHRGVFGGSSEFIGFANFTRLLADPALYRTLANTLLYTAIVLISIPIAVYLASLLNRPGLRFASVYRVLYFLPYIAMPTAVAMVWRVIYNGDFGMLNYVLRLFGVDGPYWISTPAVSIVAVGVVGLWSSLGFGMIVFAAGLK